MSNFVVAVLAYFISKKFGEFTFIKNPMIMINDLINFTIHKLYKNSVQAGGLFVSIVLGIIGFIGIVVSVYLSYFNIYIYIILSAFIASVFLQHSFTEESLQEQNFIAPLFYLALFGVAGIMLYKTLQAISITLENKKGCYKKFSKITLKTYTIANYIPDRIILQLLKLKDKKELKPLE